MTDKPKLKRGFALLSPERRLEVARLGGSSVKPENRSFSAIAGLAQSAGKAGGSAVRKKADK